MPSLRSVLRAYLGIDLILQRDSGLAARLAHIERQQTDLLRAITATNLSLTHIIVKLDPAFHESDSMVNPQTRDHILEGLRNITFREPHQ